MSFAFDTLAYVRRLRDAKVPPEQAEAMADALAETFKAPSGVATKTDIAQLETKIDALRVAAKADLAALENRLLLKLGAFIIVIAGLSLTIAGLLLRYLPALPPVIK